VRRLYIHKKTMNSPLNANILNAALEGLELQKARLEAQIAEVRTRLRQPRATGISSAPAATAAKKPRSMSAAARRRISDAQKKRWAAYHKEKGN